MKGFLPWLGGKSLLAKRIVEQINLIPHECYVEPFMGGAHVFFRREPVKTEVLNDINLELVTLFRILQWHLEEFLRYFKWALVSRDEFDRLKKVDPVTLTDIQRAARFYYLQKTCFGSRTASPAFGTSTTGHPRLNLMRMEEELSQVHLRLARVQIENIDWRECLQRYDRPHTLFYVDPPYWGHENDYGKGIFEREDYQKMAEILRGLQGSFILSLNDVPEVREIFGEFHLLRVTTRYTVGNLSNGGKGAKELLISNRPLN